MAESKKETVGVAFSQAREITPGLQSAGLKQDTARIFQPSRAVPRSLLDAATFDSVPRWFCWGLLAISALVFLIQIWNYTLS
jgi:hypothetical protein